ncbi:Phytanoyl-CoA dioxygenase (PhyH) [Paenibacillus sp. UNCCL117]|uniref:phytanoyl-CoA dioxygenase family protein n=1 Tax=unclassified Paenibacillus TaxID=185978 RepID=UPI00088BD922|nr:MULTISPECIES: phytanoyl-CoA dioxygenase family protein [unclassified Paenibacillus]SDD37811.1 Phytanoyl-CoA dioxygenase (PhyH) [Paenibacillus sp. cl123]SFW48712.1 Phytanoyl-CoA dioxygenase (PhyH) [Paenibacillus sp. UNCCL117]
MSDKSGTLTDGQKRQFVTEGYLIMKGLYSPNELEEIERTFEEISHRFIPGHFEPVLNASSADPLSRYPRVMQPHRFDETALRYMLHEPVLDVLTDLFEEEPLAAQSMFYYKPPGSRGQALHQDNFYLKVEPGNCIAAWLAVDSADMENGGMLVVPKTQEHEIVCPELADESESFTKHLVKVPEGTKAIPAVMEKGDVLFFNGNLIHGSFRNKTKDRFRRAFICHYAGQSAMRIASHYRPLLRADGSVAETDINHEGGPCGVEFEALYPH